MKKILIIDDDEDLLGIIEQILKSRGFDVHTDVLASNVSDVVKRYNPHLVLLDIRLFGQSGTDICRELKRRYSMPIILFSADTRRGCAFENCNADGFLPKPFTIDELLDTLNMHLEHSMAEA